MPGSARTMARGRPDRPALRGVVEIIVVFLVHAASVVLVLLVVGGRHLLHRSRSCRQATSTAPSAIYDTGRSVHLLPDTVDEHVTDESCECWCHPHSCLSRRASGSVVAFVDHVAKRNVA